MDNFLGYVVMFFGSMVAITLSAISIFLVIHFTVIAITRTFKWYKKRKSILKVIDGFDEQEIAEFRKLLNRIGEE